MRYGECGSKTADYKIGSFFMNGQVRGIDFLISPISSLMIIIKHPMDTKFINQHTKTRTPKSIL